MPQARVHEELGKALRFLFGRELEVNHNVNTLRLRCETVQACFCSVAQHSHTSASPLCGAADDCVISGVIAFWPLSSEKHTWQEPVQSSLWLRTLTWRRRWRTS